ncbi:MAG: NTPase [Candidatus Hydrothermarchaeota archaeon]
MNNILLTGKPRVGKSTVCKKVISYLEKKGVVAGLLTEEIREKNERKGFRIISIKTKETGILSHVNIKEGPRVGKYGINLSDLENIGVSAIEDALESDFAVIDEIGPMELYSIRFKDAVRLILDSDVPTLATIHLKSRDPFVKYVKERKDCELIYITYQNRDKLPMIISNKLEVFANERRNHKLL